MSSASLKSPKPWIMAGGDASRRGLFGLQVKPSSSRVRQLPVDAAIHASVVFDAECHAYVADMAGNARCFKRNGQERWRAKLAGGISATPAVDLAHGLVILGTHSGKVFALSCDTGTVVWSCQIPTDSDPRILSDLLLMDPPGWVVLSSWGGRFVALDSESGAERFSWDAGIFPRAPAAAGADGRIYCLRATEGKGVEWYCIDQQGKELVLHRSPEDQGGARRAVVAAAPLLDESSGQAFFLVNHDRKSTLHAWSIKQEKEAWKVALPASVQATPCMRSDGTVLVADLHGSVHGVSPEGSTRFCYSSGTEYLLASGVTEAGGYCFIGDPSGFLHRITPNGEGKFFLETQRAIQAQPSFAPDGSLYVPTCDHRVFVFVADSAG